MDFHTSELCQAFETLILEILSSPRIKLTTRITIRRILGVYEQMLNDGCTPTEIKNYITEVMKYIQKE